MNAIRPQTVDKVVAAIIYFDLELILLMSHMLVSERRCKQAGIFMIQRQDSAQIKKEFICIEELAPGIISYGRSTSILIFHSFTRRPKAYTRI